MTTNKHIPLCIFAIMLSACSDSVVESNSERQTVSTVDAYVPLKGIYYWGVEVDAFTPCGQKKDYWVFPYSDTMSKQLKFEHQNLSANPYGGIYIEIDGILGPKLHPVVVGEFPAEYDGHVVIKNINLIRRKSKADCE